MQTSHAVVAGSGPPPPPPRTLNITLSDDVLYTMPIEPDAFQGQPESCNM
jgi:hypothetical protein|eukprot:COSAG06_NODE_494_length_15057_cov_7.707782_5_plen_50_part_00